MEIKGKVHCFFEQSGTFKNEFKKLGIPAFDYDIQNNYGETDYQEDLFQAIEDAYEGRSSLFDNIEGGGIRCYISLLPLHIFFLPQPNGHELGLYELSKTYIQAA